MSNYRDQVKQFTGVVRIQDIKNEFDRLVNGINSVVTAINAIGDLADHDYSVGGNNISAPNYTMTLGALKQFLSAYDDKTVIRAPIIKCPGDNNYYKAFPGLYCDSDIGIIQTPDAKFDAGQSSHTITEEKDIHTLLTVQEDDGYVFSESVDGNTTALLYNYTSFSNDALQVYLSTPAEGTTEFDYTLRVGFTPTIVCGNLQVGDVIYNSDNAPGVGVIPCLGYIDTSSNKVIHEAIATLNHPYISTINGCTDTTANVWVFTQEGAYPTELDHVPSSIPDLSIITPIPDNTYRYIVTDIGSNFIKIRTELYMQDPTSASESYCWVMQREYTIYPIYNYKPNCIFLAIYDAEPLNIIHNSGYKLSQDQCYLMRGSTRYNFITENTTLIGGETTETVVTNPETDKNIYFNKEDKSLSMVKFNDDDVMIDICCCSKNNTPEMSQNAVANIGVNTNTAIIPDTIPTLSMNTKQFNLTDADSTLGEPKFYLGKAGDRDSTGRIYLNGKQIFANIYNYFGDAHRRHRATWQYNPLWIPRGITLPFSGVMRAIKALTFKWN